jgi:excisionase family DNA binding protein
MKPADLALADAQRRLLARVKALAERLDDHDDAAAAWAAYATAVTALRALVPPERQAFLSTAEMAKSLNLAPKTIRKLGRDGKLDGVRFGKRGTGAIRWRTA